MILFTRPYHAFISPLLILCTMTVSQSWKRATGTHRDSSTQQYSCHRRRQIAVQLHFFPQITFPDVALIGQVWFSWRHTKELCCYLFEFLWIKLGSIFFYHWLKENDLIWPPLNSCYLGQWKVLQNEMILSSEMLINDAILPFLLCLRKTEPKNFVFENKYHTLDRCKHFSTMIF